MAAVFHEIIPLVFIILIGISMKPFANTSLVPLSNVLLYVATPAIVFFGAYELNLSPGLVILPFCIFLVATLFALFCEYYTKNWWQDGTHRLLAISVGTSNTGYFGLPMVYAILGPSALPTAIMFAFGQMLFVNTIGFYLAARYQHAIKKVNLQLISSPAVYALLLGLTLNYFSVDLHISVEKTFELIKDLYIPLGLLVIGLMFSTIRNIKFDIKYLTAIILNKFLIWPLSTSLLILLDQYFFSLLTNEIYAVMLLQSIAPSGANMAALAAKFNIHPEKAALGILITTLIAIFYMPFIGQYLT